MKARILKVKDNQSLIKTEKILKPGMVIEVKKIDETSYDQQKLLMSYVMAFFQQQEKFKFFDNLRRSINYSCEYGDWVDTKILYKNRKNGRREFSDVIQIFHPRSWSYHKMTKKDIDHIINGAEEYCVKNGFKTIEEWSSKYRNSEA